MNHGVIGGGRGGSLWSGGADPVYGGWKDSRAGAPAAPGAGSLWGLPVGGSGPGIGAIWSGADALPGQGATHQENADWSGDWSGRFS
jgi:hypothetical protein